jgi:hypothetical protein
LKAEPAKLWELLDRSAPLQKMAGGFGFTEGPGSNPRAGSGANRASGRDQPVPTGSHLRSREGQVRMGPHWKDTPIAVWLKGQAHAFIYGKVPYTPHTDQGGPASRSLLIVNKRNMPDVLRILGTIEPPRRISMIAGRDILLDADGYCWESVVLNWDLERFVRQDFESFLRREEWFRRHQHPIAGEGVMPINGFESVLQEGTVAVALEGRGMT